MHARGDANDVCEVQLICMTSKSVGEREGEREGESEDERVGEEGEREGEREGCEWCMCMIM